MISKVADLNEAQPQSVCLTEPAMNALRLSPGSFSLTLKILEDIIDSYIKMHDEAVAAGNHNAAKAAKFIAGDLATCAKYSSDYYNENDDNLGIKDENAGNN